MRSPEKSEMVLKTWIGSIVVMVLIHCWIIYHRLWSDLWFVTWTHFPTWVVLAIMTGYFVFWWRTHQNYSTGELWSSLGVMPFFVYPAVALSYFFCTDLSDKEVWSGYAVACEYKEAHYTASTDSKGRRTRTYHGPTYTIKTNHGDGDEISCSKEHYEALVKTWGDSRLSRKLNNSADGIAYIHTVTWDDKKLETRIPTANEHWVVNYVKASKGILRVHGAMSGYEKKLRAYPKVHAGFYGPIEIDRVINAGTSIPDSFAADFNRSIRNHLCTLGKEKQVHVLLYLTDADIGFFEALRESWVLGKNNDVIVVVGTDGGKGISWVRAMAWTDRFEFLEALQDRIRALKTLEKGEEVANTICQQICESGSWGYNRKPMSDYRSSAVEVALPWWAYIPMLLITGILLLPTVWLCIHD